MQLSDQSILIPDSQKTPEKRMSSQEINNLNHDHHYHSTPRGMKRRYNGIRQKLHRSMTETKIQKQVIRRLRKKVSTPTDIVRELRRTRAVSESGLACLDSIAESDVSQLMKRFIKNHNSVKTKSPIKKRGFKSQRRKEISGICREKYPSALRSFACTLHFYTKFCKALPRTLKDSQVAR